jgi:hypothetical protein
MGVVQRLRRIVVGYDDAGFLKYQRRAGFEPSARSRTEALVLARELATRARIEGFDSLVTKYSEARDASRGGDMGVWSSRDPTTFPRTIDAILATPVGQVSEPVDSELGFQIFLRTKPEKRERFAMRAARFAFRPDAEPGSAASRDEAFRLAEEHLARWRANATTSTGEPEPPMLDGADAIETWSDGRGPDGADKAIPAIGIGELLPSPVVSDFTYLIAMRVAAPTVQEEPTVLGLPAPEEPDLAAFAATNSAPVIAAVLRASEAICGEQATACHQLDENFLRWVATPRSQADRTAAWAELQTSIAGDIGRSTYAAYRRVLLTAVEHAVLG